MIFDCEVTHPAGGDGSLLTLEKYLGVTGLPGATDTGE